MKTFKTRYSLVLFAIILLHKPLFSQVDTSKTSLTELNFENSLPVLTATDSIKKRLFNTGIIYSAGTEGMGLASFIRGTSILNLESNPLVVVDGIPFTKVSAVNIDFTTADERDYAALIGISQNDIKEIAILQDFTSIAQYGQTAAKGVIYITTKRSNQNKVAVNYSYKSTFGNEKKGYEMLNGDAYTTMIYEGYYNGTGLALPIDIYTEFKYSPSDPYNYFNYSQNTDWSETILQKAMTHDHYLSVSGGNNKLGINLSAGYLTQDGTIVGSGQDRYTARLVMNYSFTKNLNASFSLDYMNLTTKSNFQKTGVLPIRELALKKMPNASIFEYDELGNITNEYLMRPFGAQGPNYLNPAALVNLSMNDHKNSRLIPTLSVSYQPLKRLYYSMIVSFKENNFKGNAFFPASLTNYYLNWNDNIAEKSESKNYYWFTKNQLIYTPIHNKNHSLTSEASVSTYSLKSEGFEINEGSSYFGYKYKYKARHESLRINYLAFNKYAIDISVLGEKSDTYLDYSINPALTLQWLASNEEFLNSVSFVNKLAFNGSFALFKVVNEKRQLNNFGFNLVTWNNKIDLNLNWFNRKKINETSRFNPTAHYSNGIIILDYPWMDSQVKGWEVNLQAKIIENRNFTFNFSANLYRSTFIINDASFPLSMESSENYYISNGQYVSDAEFNKPIGNIYGFKYLGVYPDDISTIAVDQNNQQIVTPDNVLVNMQLNNTNQNYYFQPGDARYADLNYDGKINSNDLVYLGNANPKFTGSFGSMVRYRNLWLGIYFNFRYGNSIINMARMSLENMSGFDNQSTAVMRRWRLAGNETDIPRAVIGTNYNTLGSDRFVEDGSFIRLKAITLKYNFAKQITQKLHLSELGIFATCRNMFTFTHYLGADPDIHFSDYFNLGYDNNYKAVTKEFTFGINIGI